MHINNPNTETGFILVEVLVALSLILGVWMMSIGAYQGLVLRYKQQESRRSDFRRTFDAYELAEQLRASSNQQTLTNLSNISSKDIKNESSRVSSRDRAVRHVAKPTFKN